MNIPVIPDFPAKRWLKIALRTLHLVGFAGVFASILSGEDYTEFWVITMGSGGTLLLLEALSNYLWFVQVRAAIMLIKFLLLYLIFALPDFALELCISIIVLSGFISHAPSAIRYYSFVHRKKILSKRDTKG